MPLVKVFWSLQGVEEAMWEREDEIKQHFPRFFLWRTAIQGISTLPCSLWLCAIIWQFVCLSLHVAVCIPP